MPGLGASLCHGDCCRRFMALTGRILPFCVQLSASQCCHVEGEVAHRRIRMVGLGGTLKVIELWDGWTGRILQEHETVEWFGWVGRVLENRRMVGLGGSLRTVERLGWKVLSCPNPCCPLGCPFSVLIPSSAALGALGFTAKLLHTQSTSLAFLDYFPIC